MKAAILTFQMTANYGACLQCTALTQMINLLGFDCETLNYRCSNIQKRELGTRIFGSGLISTCKAIIGSISKKIKVARIKSFVRKNCALSKKIYDKSNIVYANNKYDIFISGSDIIWELHVTGGDFTYFLDFVQENKKNILMHQVLGILKFLKLFYQIRDIT